MSLVPVIDLTPGAAGEAVRRQVADTVAEACERVGFLVVTGHGVPAAVIDRAWAAAHAFFDLPEAAKRTVVMPRPGYPYGYSPVAGESLARSLGDRRPPDLKESFSIGPADLTPPPESEDAVAFAWAANLWPAEPPGFRDAMLAYYRELSGLAGRLMRLFALGLGLPESFFDGRIDRAISALRLLNYPDQPVAPEPGQLRAGAHTDYGSLTILLPQDAPGGLEVQGLDGTWHAVPTVPGGFVINLGDLMARWTNDRWRSTLHRVVNPPPDAAGSTRRQSIAFFHQPNWDAEIACLPTCLAPGETPRYPPVLSGPHLAAKFRSTVTLPQT
ncbi:isopenicillin N synthase family oxygenase [Inquilinus limosus]|uniref:isopenicillin N synthase family dioxygenase n=1 Tax=Inquilinus limosus TaxID=171674 RepID=UPI003F15D0F5